MARTALGWRCHSGSAVLVDAQGATTALRVLALDHGYERFVARILPANRAALGLVRALAHDLQVSFVGGEYEARLPLATMAAAWRHVEPFEDRLRRSA